MSISKLKSSASRIGVRVGHKECDWKKKKNTDLGQFIK